MWKHTYTRPHTHTHTHTQLPTSSDNLFIQKLYSSHESKTQSFSKPRTSTSSFCVHHYAGIVEYLNEGFVEKNMDSVFTEHISLINSSKVGVVFSSWVGVAF